MGDLLDWETFVPKYRKFVEDGQYHFHVDNFAFDLNWTSCGSCTRR